MCSGITAVHYSINIVLNTLHQPSGSDSSGFLALKFNLFPSGYLSKKTPQNKNKTQTNPPAKQTHKQNQNIKQPKTKQPPPKKPHHKMKANTPIYFIGLLAQRAKLYISDFFFLFEMIRSHLTALSY